MMHDRHDKTPFSDALLALGKDDWLRLHVPAHQGNLFFGDDFSRAINKETLAIDLPMLFSGVDQNTWRLFTPGQKTPLDEAQALAADLWGARRIWFLANGASSGNHIATSVVRTMGKHFVVQRNAHSSIVDGMSHTGLVPTFIAGHVSADLGSSFAVTAAQVREALKKTPEATSVYITSPSYFGAISDIVEIASVAHEHGLPLIVDEAWGSHLGTHPAFPENAIRLGADLVISSTHKAAGSLTQSAMLQLREGPYADDLEARIEHVFRSFQSTSSSALLFASLDEARRNLAVNGHLVDDTLSSISAIRKFLGESPVYSDATERMLDLPGTFAVDPLKIVIDTRKSGLSGSEVQHTLIKDHKIYCELSTPNSLLLLFGATARVDHERFIGALESIPTRDEPFSSVKLTLPAPSERVLLPNEAFYGQNELVHYTEAAGRISASSLAAYPPGIPNVIPGERLTVEIIDFLREVSQSPTGFVRGVASENLEFLRVLKE